jgi:hypothetical protein
LKRLFILIACPLLLGAGLSEDLQAAATRRIALAVGANKGASDRVSLRYAVSDAERFARLIMRMGGVDENDLTILREPSRRSFLDALTAAYSKAAQSRASNARVELLVYFSGHADDKGLMLGREILDYRDLRSAIQNVGADVGVTILDACASGAITRLKGGQAHPAFLSDLSTQVQGYAFLTSSSENEAAQESDRLQGSYFTHALLSGLRGAADVSGDGKVTLGEAYQFAFGETLAATTSTQGGAQHPTWDIKMAGTGDVVLTDVRQTSSSLALSAEMEGRFFVHNPKRQLVAELYKPAGRAIELGLEPGEYDVHFEHEPALLRSRIALAEGQHLVLDRGGFRPARRVPTRRRGRIDDAMLSPYLLDGRSRCEMRFGASRANFSIEQVSEEDQNVLVGGGEFDFIFSHWVRDDLALELSFGGSHMGVSTIRLADGKEVDTQGLLHFLCGARFYPPIEGAFRPYVSAAVGPMTEIRVQSFTPSSSTQENKTDVNDRGTRLGAYLGGGVDFLISRRFHLGLYSGTILRSDYKRRIGLGVGLSWVWGMPRIRQ